MSVTLLMPTLDPSRAGLTKQGSVISAAASIASTSVSSTVCASRVTLRAVAMPFAPSTTFTIALSIVSADASTPEPT